ncbi:hypothetical protein [Streptosporangium amethystogenes]|uniref:hypothetical protein n=1 Tax=Streptosporangium amethystogenes TaxID=2002 RepID=UPI0004BD3EE8|nr:hypothetical protein [Streptosporangium amethystogenes]KUJ65436.1 hypothetical protein ACZ90_48065 [Streptomyces albus subsp. albus]
MPGTTPRGYEYPLYGDTQNVPTQVQALAEDIDADVQSLYTANTTARNAPTASISSTGILATPSGALTTMTFTDELYDNAGMVNLGVNNTIITIPQTGLYLVSGTVTFNIAASTTPLACALFLRSVGGLVPDISTVTKALGSPQTSLSMVSLTRCNAGETISLATQHNYTSPIDVSPARLYVTKVAP